MLAAHRASCAYTREQPIVIACLGECGASAVSVDDQVECQLTYQRGEDDGFCSKCKTDGAVVDSLSDGIGAQCDYAPRWLGEEQEKQPGEPVAAVDVGVVE